MTPPLQFTTTLSAEVDRVSAVASCRGQHAHRFPQHVFSLCTLQVRIYTQFLEHSPDFTLPEAQVAQRRRHHREYVRHLRLRYFPIPTPIRMPEPRVARSPHDDQLSTMHRPMMRAAQRDQILGVIAT